MERLFRSFKTEWLPSVGYTSAQEAHRYIGHYLMYRYNWIRPHQFNDGLAPAVAEEKLRGGFIKTDRPAEGYSSRSGSNRV